MNKHVPAFIKSFPKFLKRFQSWAIDKVDPQQHQDLVELRKELERLSAP